MHFEINALGILLEKYPNLKVFDGIRHKIDAVYYLADRPWICQGLEYLRCQIVGFCRLTNEEEAIFNDNDGREDGEDTRQ
jgi:hypothetical protein